MALLEFEQEPILPEKEMSEHRDEEPESKPEEQERQPGSYYYDDATGYEIYDPAQDEEEDENDVIDDQFSTINHTSSSRQTFRH